MMTKNRYRDALIYEESTGKDSLFLFVMVKMVW